VPDERRIQTRAAVRRTSQLDGIRARVAVLCRRIKESRDPDAIREVQNELNRVGQVLGTNEREGGHG
jgi:hypothetical protein